MKIQRNIYGQKQAVRVWHEYLKGILINKLNFVQSEVDECLFFKRKTLYLLYTDDSVLAGPDRKEIEHIMEERRKTKLNITVEGELQDFLEVNIDRKEDGTIYLTQLYLIISIVNDLHLSPDKISPHRFNTPESPSKILLHHPNLPSFIKFLTIEV